MNEKLLLQLTFEMNKIKQQLGMDEITLPAGGTLSEKMYAFDNATKNLQESALAKVPDSVWDLHAKVFPEDWENFGGEVNMEQPPPGGKKVVPPPPDDKPRFKAPPPGGKKVVPPPPEDRPKKTKTKKVGVTTPVPTVPVVDYESIVLQLLPLLTREQLDILSKPELIALMTRS